MWLDLRTGNLLLQAGHPFQQRCAQSAYSNGKLRSEAPVFLLFLDCVWQILRQFPCSFQFNEKFLVILFEHAYASQFGTFLGNRVAERLAFPSISVSFLYSCCYCNWLILAYTSHSQKINQRISNRPLQFRLDTSTRALCYRLNIAGCNSAISL